MNKRGNHSLNVKVMLFYGYNSNFFIFQMVIRGKPFTDIARQTVNCDKKQYLEGSLDCIFNHFCLLFSRSDFLINQTFGD
jgi:hypothetical protein